jgi:hypothetical protein
MNETSETSALGDTMRTSIFKSLAYVYVALALAPLVLITIALVVALARGGDVLLWNMFSGPPRGPAATENVQGGGEHVTFRTELLPLAKDRFNPSAADHYALGVGHVSAGAAGNAAMPAMQPSGFDKRSGQFNNVLMLDRQTGRLSKLFDRRMSVTFFGAVDLPAGKGLVVFAAGADTNKDGVLDAKDLHGVFVYAPGDAKLHKVAGIDGSAVALDEAIEPGSLVVRAVIDLNKDGSAVEKPPFVPSDVEEEPERLYKLDLTTFAAAPLVPPSMAADLQNALAAPPPKTRRDAGRAVLAPGAIRATAVRKSTKPAACITAMRAQLTKP